MSTVRVDIFVDELVNVMTMFDKIEVQRSVPAPPSTVEIDLTTSSSQPARIVGTSEGPFLLHAKVLVFSVNDFQVSVTFTNIDPMAVTQVATAINVVLVGIGVLAVADTYQERLRLSTSGTGTQYTLEIIGGSAAPVLGFVVGQKENGTDSRISLAMGVDQYQFDDGSGIASNYYRSRFYNSSNGTHSAWSDWLQGTIDSVIANTSLILAKVKLAGLDGAALTGKVITISNIYQPLEVDGYGIFGAYLVLVTDGLGKAETTLVRGSLVDVVFSGTSIARRIQVPTTGTEFDLLDNSLVVGDEFQIQRPDLPYAPRRS